MNLDYTGPPSKPTDETREWQRKPLHEQESEHQLTWTERLSDDLALAMVCLLGVLAMVAIAPFAVYRLLQGNFAAALLDGLFVVGLAGGAVHAWITGNSRQAGMFMALLTTSGCIAVVWMLGLTPMWAFSTILAHFIVVDRRIALALSALIIVAIAACEPAFSSPVDRFSFVAVSSMVTLFALIFSTRSARQNARLRHLAETDSLTEAGNRRSMKNDLMEAVHAFEVSGKPQALVIMDLDHFKQVNDRFGHEAGDRVLADLAAIVHQTTRRGDSLYRYGGEEFVLLFGDTDVSGLETAVNKIQAALAERLRGPGGPVTVSMGATLLQPGDGWLDWMARADDALYQAKNDGRDRAVIDVGDAPLILVGPASI